jgi:hypothetical protein
MKTSYFIITAIIIALITVGLTGCAAKYTHATKSTQDFARDRRDCEAIAEKTAAKRGVPVCEETRNCLETHKGWRRVLW